jgi:hypothetical protein
MHFPQLHHGKKGWAAIISRELHRIIFKVQGYRFFDIVYHIVKTYALAEDIEINAFGAVHLAIMTDFNLYDLFHLASSWPNRVTWIFPL